MEKAKYKYYVDVKEVWTNKVIVESEEPLTPEQLRKMVEDDVEEGNLHYDYTLDSEDWPTGEL